MRYSIEPRDSAKKSTTDAIKTDSKKAIQKSVDATDDSDKITSASKSSKNLH